MIVCHMEELFDDGQSADKLPPDLAELDARRKADGKDPKENPAQLPKTDLDARILPHKEGGYAANYTPMCLNDMLSGFIVEADVVIGNVEHTCMTAMVDTVSSEYNITVDTMMADSAYSPGENLTAMEARNINLLSPLAEKTYIAAMTSKAVRWWQSAGRMWMRNRAVKWLMMNSKRLVAVIG